MTNIEYYFEDCLPNSNNKSTITICRKEFFQELILASKINSWLCYICFSFSNLLFKKMKIFILSARSFAGFVFFIAAKEAIKEDGGF
ncbi:MAG: hypothetical protein LBH04_10450 [Tannerellaceae bacterium]|jgi:hypothetical protein|nr:hypothetical protein [Tannerellaceae bacterium]